MYKTVQNTGDSLPVPQLVFAKLSAPGGDDVRFRVALFALLQGNVDADGVATALRISRHAAEKALEYWEGSGLLEKEAAPSTEPALPSPPTRRRLTTREATEAGNQDPMLGQMVTEVQRIFGGVVSPGDINVLLTLNVVDGIPADLILLAAGHFAAKGVYSARYLEKTLRAWKRDGITDYAAAEEYLKKLALREKREGEVASLLGLPADGFTLAEKRRIASWYEEYGYSKKMLEAARLAAGDKQNDVAYLTGILKKWYAKGYKTPRDVQNQSETRNLRVQGGGKPAGSGILGAADEYVPLKQRRNNP